MSNWVERKEAQIERTIQTNNLFASKARIYWDDIIARVKKDAVICEEKLNRKYHIGVQEKGTVLVVFSVLGQIVRVTAKFDFPAIRIKEEWFKSLSDDEPRRTFNKSLDLAWDDESQTVYVQADTESGISMLNEVAEMVLNPKPVQVNLPTRYGIG